MKEAYLTRCSYVDDSVVLGNNVSIGCYTIIEEGCHIGDNTYIGNYVRIAANTYIGNDCIISDSCHIGGMVDLCFNDKTKDFIEDTNYEHRGIEIGNNVVLMDYVKVEAAPSNCQPTHIGDHCFIGVYGYIRFSAYLGPRTCLATSCIISDNARLDGDNKLYTGTLVGHKTHLKKGCKGINRVIFENDKTYEAEWHISNSYMLFTTEACRRFRKFMEKFENAREKI